MKQRFLVASILVAISASVAFESGLASITCGPITTGVAGGAFAIDGRLNCLSPGSTDWYQSIAGSLGVLQSAPNCGVSTGVNAVALFCRDAINPDPDPTVFLGSSNWNSDNIDALASPWSYTSGQSPGNDDLSEVYATVYTDGNGQVWLVVGAAYASTNGDKHFDFELNQNGVHLNPTLGKVIGDGPSGGRTGGVTPDLVVSIDYKQGGGSPCLHLRKWDAPSLTFIPMNAQPLPPAIPAGDTSYSAVSGQLNGGANTPTSCPVVGLASGHALVDYYEKDQFAEAAINLTAYFGSGFDITSYCNQRSTLMVKTRCAGSSGFDDAQLKDFALVPFSLMTSSMCRIVSVSPSSGVAGTVFSEPGSGFSPNGTVELHFRKPPPPGGDGLEYDPPYLTVQADASGNYTHTYNSSTASQFGTYQYWAVDLTTGTQSNIASFQIDPRTPPVVSVSPSSGAAGTIFSEPGSGFIPNSTVELHFRKPPPPAGDGLQYEPPYLTVQSDATGSYVHDYNSSTASQFGTYQYWAIDVATGRRSNTMSFTIGPPLTPMAFVSPTSGSPGTTFTQSGTGFTSNASVELHFRKPLPPDGDGLEYNPPYPTEPTDATGNFAHAYNSSTASQFGSYQYWAIDLATGRQSNTTSFEVVAPCSQGGGAAANISTLAATPCSGPQTFTYPVGGNHVLTCQCCTYNARQCRSSVCGTYHTAMDFSLSNGEDIRAAAAGIIHLYPYDPRLDANGIPKEMNHNLGNVVIIEHELLAGGHVSSLYAHLESIDGSLVDGDRVCRGRRLGKMGKTGGEYLAQPWGVHLHFEIKNDPVLGNPDVPGHPANSCFGYMGSNADGWGYHDPAVYFDRVTVKAFEVSTAALEIAPPEPYYPGDVISGRFVLSNTSDAPAHLDVLLIAGRGPGGDIMDFPPVYDVDISAGGTYTYQAIRSLPQSGRYHFAPAFESDGVWQTILNPSADNVDVSPVVMTNLAYGRPCYVTTNGAEDHTTPCTGQSPSDIVDGDLSYAPVGSGTEDGCVGWQNNDYDQPLVVTASIDLGQPSLIACIRYNMGNCQRADAWGADFVTSPLGRTAAAPGGSYAGVWTQQAGARAMSTVPVTLEKTRTSADRDWLFVGELETWGMPPAATAVTSSSITGPNNLSKNPAAATGLSDGQFVALGVGGEAVLDLGTDVLDASGNDLRVAVVDGTGTEAHAARGAATGSSVEYSVYGSEDGWNWSVIGTASQTADFDFATAGLDAVRYVRIVDEGGGDPLATAPGVHLDAVQTAWSDASASVPATPLPEAVMLEAPFPNPSLGGLMISFTTPQVAKVNLSIYDIAGRLISVLVDKPLEAGQHNIRWDGATSDGIRANSGVYFCQLSADQYHVTRRIVILK